MKKSEFRNLIREEIQKVLKENNEPFLDAVFDTMNDQMRAHEITEDEFEAMKDFLDNNELKISNMFSTKGQDGIEQAVDFIRQQTN